MASSAPPQQALDLVHTSGFERRFVVARNPDAESSLPYLLWVPVGAGLTLKAAEPWPLSSLVYCHPFEDPVAENLDVLEEVGVRMCAWRGRAVDLVLDRARHNRSQFVFTTARGRPAIFWQTPFVTRRSRRGRRAGGMSIEVDSHEQGPYAFAGRQVALHEASLPAGDYAVRGKRASSRRSSARPATTSSPRPRAARSRSRWRTSQPCRRLHWSWKIGTRHSWAIAASAPASWPS